MLCLTCASSRVAIETIQTWVMGPLQKNSKWPGEVTSMNLRVEISERCVSQSVVPSKKQTPVTPAHLDIRMTATTR